MCDIYMIYMSSNMMACVICICVYILYIYIYIFILYRSLDIDVYHLLKYDMDLVQTRYTSMAFSYKDSDLLQRAESNLG